MGAQQAWDDVKAVGRPRDCSCRSSSGSTSASSPVSGTTTFTVRRRCRPLRDLTHRRELLWNSGRRPLSSSTKWHLLFRPQPFSLPEWLHSENTAASISATVDRSREFGHDAYKPCVFRDCTAEVPDAATQVMGEATGRGEMCSRPGHQPEGNQSTGLSKDPHLGCSDRRCTVVTRHRPTATGAVVLLGMSSAVRTSTSAV